MEMGKNSKRNLAISFAVFTALAAILVTHVAATDEEFNLPSTLISIEVSDGTENYFDTELSHVPLGYDVTNGTYPGWCIDVRTEMTRSPAIHIVKLYSSMSPPGELAGDDWDMVNYILNNKQGTAEDVQQSIWYFIHMDGDDYIPTSPVAWDIINDALANGSGFVPEYGQIVAVVCYPIILFPSQPDVQISIIEVSYTVIPEFPSGFILPISMLTTLLAIIVYRSIRPRAKNGHASL